MKIIDKVVTHWNTVERPKKESIFLKGKLQWTIIIGLCGIIFGFGLVYFSNLVIGLLPLHPSLGGSRYLMHPSLMVYYDLWTWAPSYFIYFFLMVLPIIFANVFYRRTRTPIYGFSAFGGIIIGGFIAGMILEPWFAFYLVWVVGCSMIGNIPSQRDYKLHAYHLWFFFALGFLCGYLTCWTQIISHDVWVFLQFVHVYVFMVLIAGMKIRTWSYMFMLGWALSALLAMIFPQYLHLPSIISGIPIVETVNIELVVGIFNLIAPPLVVLVVWTYFFKIQRRTNAESKKYWPICKFIWEKR